MDLAERFWAKVDRGPLCWEWMATTNPSGHGRFSVGDRENRRMVLAHRFAFECVVGPIPAGLVLDHLCENPACVNPDHLEPVTRAENTRRSLRMQECQRGHPFDEQNTYAGRDGRRQCRTCHRLRQRAYRGVTTCLV